MKLIWHNFALFMFCYILIAIIYSNLLLTQGYETSRKQFELLCIYCSRFRILIPIHFLVGFYVSEVIKRYWDQFLTLPYPDRLALKLVSYVPGKDHFRRNLRRTIMRYVNLSIVLVFRLVSTKVKSRFPDYESLVNAKLMLQAEVIRMQKSELQTPHEATWTPVLWALKLLERARTEGKIKIEAPVYANLVSSFEYLEISNRKILNYGWVNFPLAYTQIANFSVYMYVFVSLFACQFLHPPECEEDDIECLKDSYFKDTGIHFSSKSPFDDHTPDIIVPWFTMVEFICYMGWIKVAETLLNPFGEDDEDFQINYLIDRNVQVSYMIVDDADMEMEMAKDPFLEAGIAIPPELPYKDEKQRDQSARDVVGQTGDEEAGLRDRFRKISNAFIRRPSNVTLAKVKRLESTNSRAYSIPEDAQIEMGNESIDSTKL